MKSMAVTDTGLYGRLSIITNEPLHGKTRPERWQFDIRYSEMGRRGKPSQLGGYKLRLTR